MTRVPLRRFLAVPPAPKFDTGGPRVASSLKYVRDVDEHQRLLAQLATDADKAAMLIEKISQNETLLYMLSNFHYELARIGIDRAGAVASRPLWRYRWKYFSCLARLSNTFWSQCQEMDLAQHTHPLGTRPDTIGVLDPRNFSAEVYRALQSGQHNGTDFRHVAMLGGRAFGGGSGAGGRGLG